MRGKVDMSAPDPDTTSQILQNPIIQFGARWIGEIIFGLCLTLLALLKFIGKRALNDIDTLKSVDVISREEVDDRFDKLEKLIKDEVRGVHSRIDGHLDKRNGGQ